MNIPEILHCPLCNGHNLHHDDVDVFTRTEEDGPSRCTRIPASGLARDIIGLINPSERRDGIRIRFKCEGCDHISQLAIAQIKGQTHMEWA